jgi:hypothetical protein
MKYFIAVAFIWIGCTVAWIVLGSTLVYRSGETSSELTNEVDRLWGPPLSQAPPVVTYQQPKIVKEKTTSTDAQGRTVENVVEREVIETHFLPLVGSDVRAHLALEHRQKGLLWFPTYGVDFGGRYEFANDTAVARDIDVRFPLGTCAPNTEERVAAGCTTTAVYDGFRIEDERGARRPIDVKNNVASFVHKLEPGEKFAFRVQYRARGRSSFRYALTEGSGRVDAFRMRMTTDFAKVDFPAGTLSPSKHGPTERGWAGEWNFDSLVASSGIGVDLPQKVNPGPLASRITFFAPVGLLFFVFVVSVLSAASAARLHPMHYFFIGCAFFAFHLLFAYTVDHIALAQAFAVASATSLLLVVSYGRLFLGFRRALTLLGVPQLVYLVLFSATFFWEGYTGLAVAVGAILTLFVIMQITGRVRWDQAFGRPPTPRSAVPPPQVAYGAPSA